MLAIGCDSGCAPSTSCEGRRPSSFQLPPCIRCWALSNLLLGQAAFRGREREPFSESRMREIRPSGFDEREQETGPGQTGLRGRGETRVTHPPGDSTHCAGSRLYSLSRNEANKQHKPVLWPVFNNAGGCDASTEADGRKRTCQFCQFHQRFAFSK